MSCWYNLRIIRQRLLPVLGSRSQLLGFPILVNIYRIGLSRYQGWRMDQFCKHQKTLPTFGNIIARNIWTFLFRPETQSQRTKYLFVSYSLGTNVIFPQPVANVSSYSLICRQNAITVLDALKQQNIAIQITQLICPFWRFLRSLLVCVCVAQLVDRWWDQKLKFKSEARVRCFVILYITLYKTLSLLSPFPNFIEV